MRYTSRDLPTLDEVRYVVRAHCSHPEMPEPTHKTGRRRRIQTWEQRQVAAVQLSAKRERSARAVESHRAWARAALAALGWDRLPW